MTSDLITLTIDELAGGGDGVGHHGDRAVFVPDTVPGDRVRVQVQRRQRRYWRATLEEVLEPGPGRQDPGCAHSLICGGCQWHHVRYDHQLQAKGGLLARAFRQARVDAPAASLLSAPAPLGYRCRARLHFRRLPDGTLLLGFLGRRSHRVVDLRACPVLLEGLSSLLSELRPLFPPAPTGGELGLLGNERGDRALALPGAQDPRAAIVLGEGLTPAACQEIDQQPPGTGPPFWTTPEAFFQANPAVNRLLCDLVSKWAADAPRDRAHPWVELYAGSGNLTRGLARLGPVIAVESQAPAVALARRNLGAAEVQWVTGDARTALQELVARGLTPALVVLDPPRTGARELLDDLIRLGPTRVLYVSCDPMTLARDVAQLTGAGYRLWRLCALDTMPQTHHFETVAELRRA